MKARPALPTRDARLETVRGASLLALFALQGAGVGPSQALMSAQVATLLAMAVVAGRVYGRTLQRQGFAACFGLMAHRASQYALAFAVLGALLLALRAADALDAGALATWQRRPDAPVHLLLPLPDDPLLYQWRECILLRAGPVPLQLLALGAWLLLATPVLLWLMRHLPPGAPAAAALALACSPHAHAWSGAPFEMPHPLGIWLGVWMLGLLAGTQWDALMQLRATRRHALAAALVAAGLALMAVSGRPEVATLCLAAAVLLSACTQLEPSLAMRCFDFVLKRPAQWPVLAWSLHGVMLLVLAALAPQHPAAILAGSAAALAAVVGATGLAEREQSRRRRMPLPDDSFAAARQTAAR